VRLSHRGRVAVNAALAAAVVAVVLAAVWSFKNVTRPFSPAACQATAGGTTF